MNVSEDDLRKEREGLVSQRDLALANYHRLCGAIGVIDLILKWPEPTPEKKEKK